MTAYKNEGPKTGNKEYLVVNGTRVYTGDKFDASEEDVKSLKNSFNIKSYKREQKDIVSAPRTNEVEEIAPIGIAAEVSTEEDKALSSETSKSTNNEKGVK